MTIFERANRLRSPFGFNLDLRATAAGDVFLRRIGRRRERGFREQIPLDRLKAAA
jgi:hypothetical protein